MISDWIERCSQNYIFSDEIFVQLASIALNRKIKIYSVMDKANRDRTIEPHADCSCGMQTPNEPLYLLYFEDAHFRSPHYQSIRPKSESNSSHPEEQVYYQIMFEKKVHKYVHIYQIFFEQ